VTEFFILVVKSSGQKGVQHNVISSHSNAPLRYTTFFVFPSIKYKDDGLPAREQQLAIAKNTDTVNLFRKFPTGPSLIVIAKTSRTRGIEVVFKVERQSRC